MTVPKTRDEIITLLKRALKEDENTWVVVRHDGTRYNDGTSVKITDLLRAVEGSLQEQDERKELDALDWCKMNHVSIHYESGIGDEVYDVTVEIGGYSYAAETLERAVALAEHNGEPKSRK